MRLAALVLIAAVLTWLLMDQLVTWAGLNDLPPIPPRSAP